MTDNPRDWQPPFDDDDEPKPRGKTSVKKKKKKSSARNGSGAEIPRVLRVTATPQKALDIWIKRVENSGCMKEG